MGFFSRRKRTSKNTDDFDEWMKSATDEQINQAYNERQRKWMDTGYGGNGVPTPEMKKLDKEMARRSHEKWEKDPNRNTDPNFRWTDKNRWERD